MILMGQFNNQNQPLADRMRSSNLAEFFGQEELIGGKSFLKQMIESDTVNSMILWGPPGTGKTTLAHIIAEQTKSRFIRLSAVTSGVKDLRQIIDGAEQGLRLGEKTILFVDEIHRWNKAQQDALLPHVERGIITLIGATTENPSFSLNSALLSRARVFVLNSLETKDLIKILNQALKDEDKGLGKRKVKIKSDIIELIAKLANGDARAALNTLELCSLQHKAITKKLVKEVLQKQNLRYDRNADEHYNIISALHKSMRGGNADAAVYWLVRMLEGGEDPLYIARRLVRFASEDIGMANNTALLIANEVFTACQRLGMPECGVHLSHCVIYLAKSKKDISAYMAYNNAIKDVREHGNLGVPLHLRNAASSLMKELGYGKGYKYSPMEDSSKQEYFPEELKGKKYL